MLVRLARSGNTVFYEQELRAAQENNFELLRSLGLLSRLPDLGVGDSYDFETGPRQLTIVPDGRGQLEALDLEDTDFPPLPLTDAMKRQWQLSVTSLAQRLQETNGLAGRYEALTPELHFIGEQKLEASRTAVLLWLSGAEELVNRLYGLPAQLGEAFDRYLILTLGEAKLSERLRLKALGIELVLLDSDNPFVIPVHVDDERRGLFLDAGLLRNTDYYVVEWRTQTFRFRPPQALAIRIMHDAYKNGAKEVRWEEIETRLTELKSFPHSMRDLFRRTGAQGTLVLSADRRGYYKLDLD